MTPKQMYDIVSKGNQRDMKTKEDWISSKERLPDFNRSVLVFIPEEDNHITVGMWDVSQKWVLLDEYRVPRSEVTHWAECPPEPNDKSYTPSEHRPYAMDTLTYQISTLQKQVFDYQQSIRELEQKNERLTQMLRELLVELDGHAATYGGQSVVAIHKGKAEAYRYSAKKLRDIFQWLGITTE
jgi:hypothetical protein